MKKIIIFITILSVPLLSDAQFLGLGTSESPYRGGTLKTDTTWYLSQNPIYVSGDLTIGTASDAGYLTIEPGVTVRFCSTGTDLIITGLGQFTADGSSTSQIRFTADTDKDGIYGESGETWGHISFQSMGSAEASVFNNCIVEYGDVSSTSLTPNNPNRYGGAIHTDFSNLTISNCEIRYNSAGWGGGIFIGNGENPAISNCYIHNNTSTTSGGGIYFWTDSYSTVTNCIITYNSCTGTGGGGGLFFGGYAKNVKIINSVISHNSANDESLGHNIKFFNNFSTTKPSLTNSIIWYPANSIVYVTGGSNATDFINCAIQDPPITYTNCINLNSDNDAVDGPNFTATDGSDWSIKFVSPCRDAGTTPSPTVPYDYTGINPRIGSYDIGAYEVRYSRWTGASSTGWTDSGNWEEGITPSLGTGDAVIPSGLSRYPGEATITISSGNYLIIDPGGQLDVGTLTNNGTLRLRSDASGIASMIVNTYTGSGTEEIQLFLTGGGTRDPLTYKWHYISSPVTSLAVSTFAPGATLDLAQWIESRPITSLSQGWVAYDGYIYSTGEMGGPTFSTLVPGKGYDFWDSADNTFTFSGLLNTEDVNASLSYKSGDDTLWGYNLIGNPFTSGLDWDYIITHSFPSNTTKSLYFTRNSVLCTYINGVGVPSDVNGIIPPMQGFFSKTYSSENTIVLAAAARTHINIHARYKGSQIIPLVRLSLTDSALSDETVVRFDNQAKSYLDNDFDAVKMFLSPDLTSIYSSSAGTDYAINGLPFPNTLVEIPVTINLTTDTTLHTITATQLQGLDNYDVTLKDNATGFTADLKTTPMITFSATRGTITGRFVLKVSTIITGTENPVIPKNIFNIYPANNMINIRTISDNWDGLTGSVKVLDITGKTVTNKQDAEFSKNSLLQVSAPVMKGIYIIELKSGVMKFVGKVIIR